MIRYTVICDRCGREERVEEPDGLPGGWLTIPPEKKEICAPCRNRLREFFLGKEVPPVDRN
ncbi:MAG: hypothetical protein DRH30_13490 [Deltaproteobacteria bacterium]|nr:MAG: hypothetical protein DRH30_13490 [Deltaproteobacteria bacterium]